MNTNKRKLNKKSKQQNCSTAKPQQRKTGYKFIDHPSDVGMEVEGETLNELFINAAKGMLSLISEPVSRNKKISKQLHLKEDSPEELLHSYLSEILWFITNERFFPLKIYISRINESSLDAKLEGIRLKKEEMKGEVKALTYHQLKIIRRDQIWFTRLIFDV